MYKQHKLKEQPKLQIIQIRLYSMLKKSKFHGCIEWKNNLKWIANSFLTLITKKSEMLKGTKVFLQFLQSIPYLTTGKKNVFTWSQHDMMKRGNFSQPNSRLPNIKSKSVKYSKDQSMNYRQRKKNPHIILKSCFHQNKPVMFLAVNILNLKCPLYLCWMRSSV